MAYDPFEDPRTITNVGQGSGGTPQANNAWKGLQDWWNSTNKTRTNPTRQNIQPARTQNPFSNMDDWSTQRQGEIANDMWQNSGYNLAQNAALNNAMSNIQGLYNLQSNTTGWMQPGQQSIGGQYYKGYESSALNNLQGLQSQNLSGAGNEVLGLLGNITAQNQASKSDLTRALEQRALMGTQGGLTPESYAYYQSQAAPLDIAADEERTKALQGLGQNRGLWGSARTGMEAEIATKLGAQKQQLLGNIMQQDVERGMQLALQDNNLQSAALGIASQLYGQVGNQRLNASNQILNQAAEAGRQYLSQTQMQMQETLANIQNQFQAAQMEGNMAQFLQNADVQQRQVVQNGIANYFNNLMGAQENIWYPAQQATDIFSKFIPFAGGGRV